MNNYFPGQILIVDLGYIKHVGIVTEATHFGEPTVISSSLKAGGVQEEPLSVFSQGKPVIPGGYPGSLEPWQVIARARAAIGTKYDAIRANCEHFVTWAHGLPPRSPQLAVWAGASILATLAAIIIFKKAGPPK